MIKTKKRSINKNKNNSKKNIKHNILGSNNIGKYCELFKIENKKISIKVNGENTLVNKKIHCITIPHAGFEYSGLFGLYAIEELLKFYNKNNLTLTILWFLHNPNKDQEHSLQNILELLKCNFSNIKVEAYEVNKNTKYSDMAEILKPPFIVSTDFSHHNYGNSASSIIPVWENDRLIFENKEIIDVDNIPCGNQPLRILKEYCKDKKLDLGIFGYSNSKNKYKWWETDNDIFNGVTYGALACFNSSWYNNIYNNMLAYSHLHWVDKIFKEDIILDESCNPKTCGLFWSYLLNMKGSCFITVNDKYDRTYSCMGSWEPNSNNLLETLIKALISVKTSYWHNNSPVNKDILENKLENKYSIVITLIEPIKYWKKYDRKVEKNKGYVFYNDLFKKVGMTYLPSVWKLYKNKNDFFEGLKIKHNKVYSNSDWDIYSYNSISWKLNNI